METLAILMTIKELSNYLSIKEKTIYAKVEKNEITHYRIGKLIRFKKDEIDKWLEGCRNGHKPERDAIKKKKRKFSKLSGGHVNLIARNIIDEETRKYYDTDHGKSDRIKDPKKENNYGSL